MEKYMKKPTEIEAIKLTKDNIFEVSSEVYTKPDLNTDIAKEKWENYVNIVTKYGMDIQTNEGRLKLKIGNYLVKEYSKKLGYHYWPVDADYFEENYIKVI